MSRVEVLDELFRAKVPACQVTVDELMEEVDRVVEANCQRISADPSRQSRPA
jgi:putative N-acetylmannosamine-6-phosphate epimerase